MRALWGFVPLLHRDYEGQTSSVIFFSYYFSFLLCTCNQELRRNYLSILVETKVIDYLLSELFILVMGKTFTSAEKEMRTNHKSSCRFAHMLLSRYLLISLRLIGSTLYYIIRLLALSSQSQPGCLNSRSRSCLSYFYLNWQTSNTLG
jgi:hypothetical protein